MFLSNKIQQEYVVSHDSYNKAAVKTKIIPTTNILSKIKKIYFFTFLDLIFCNIDLNANFVNFN